MGKVELRLVAADEPHHETTMERADFIQCVEEGILHSDQTLQRGLEASTVLDEEDKRQLRAHAQTAAESAAFTWKIKNSCGCPIASLPKWDLIETDSDCELDAWMEEFGSLQNVTFVDYLKSGYQRFATGFDLAVSSKTGASEGDILLIKVI